MVNFGYPYNDLVICKDSTDYLAKSILYSDENSSKRCFDAKLSICKSNKCRNLSNTVMNDTITFSLISEFSVELKQLE